MKLTKKQYQILNRVASENGFSNYEIITSPGAKKGENFLGIITSVSISNKEKVLELILKTAQTSEEFRKEVPLTTIFDREIYMYKYVFEEFKKFQHEYNITDPFITIPKSFAFSSDIGDEFFIMENLKSVGYELWNRKILMNIEHIEEVLKEYAKFHAVSLAIRDKNPKLFDVLGKHLSKHVFEEKLSNPKKLGMYINDALNNAYEAVKDNQVLTEYLQRFHSVLPDFFMKESIKPEYQLVAVHADGWCNNFLFKYKDPDNRIRPCSLRIVDWQLSHLSTPAVDFCHFFMVESPNEILHDYRKYLQLYYDTLSLQLRNFKCDPEHIFPYSILENHVNVFMKFGLFRSIIVTKQMVCDSDEAPDFVEISEHDNIANSMDFKIKNFEVYRDRIIHLIQFFKDCDFI